MHIFIDDSGSFSWHNPGISLFAGVLIPDRDLPELEARFLRWKRTIIGKSNRELKGEELTEGQLYSFTYQVLPRRLRNPLLTMVGANTRLTKEDVIRRSVVQVADQFAYCAKFVLQKNPTNSRLSQSYTEMAGWVGNRSTQNFLWVSTLEEAIIQCTQHLTAYFYDEEYDADFENIEVVIDRSFIKRERHVSMWKEWLRNGLMGRSHRGQGFTVLDQWSKRNHPFIRKYRREGGLFEFNDLYHKHTRFDDSKGMIGLQVADICAHICYRHYRRTLQGTAHRQLHDRIVGQGGRKMTIIHLTEESLYKDGVEKHVQLMDIEGMKQAAARRSEERERRRQAASGEGTK